MLIKCSPCYLQQEDAPGSGSERLPRHPVAVDYRCHHRGIANLCISNTAILEKKRNNYTVWRQYNEMPSLILGCPGTANIHVPNDMKGRGPFSFRNDPKLVRVQITLLQTNLVSIPYIGMIPHSEMMSKLHMQARLLHTSHDPPWRFLKAKSPALK